jgi:uncharacterized membrane protein YbhN (UPF0104 family)
MMLMVQPHLQLQGHRRQLALFGLVLVGLYAVVPQLGSFRDSWHILSQPNITDVVWAIICTAGTYLAAAMIYYWLAFRRVRYGQLILVQLAAMFVNRLLPAGLGALGVNFAYLRRQKHSPAQATTVVGINNLFGFLGNMILLASALLFNGHSLSTGHHLSGHTVWLLVGAIIIVGLLVIVLAGKRMRRFVADVTKQIVSYRQRPWSLVAALLSSMILTLCNTGGLYFCLLAFGVHLSFATALLILTLGVGVGAATPTPGGLGGFEAGLVAGFVAYHVDSATALAIALLYRFISYWLALAVGALAFVVSQRQKLLG